MRDNEIRLLTTLLKNKEGLYSVIFDGTPRNGDCMAVVVRVCIGFKVHQKLVGLPTLSKSADGAVLAATLFNVLVTRYGLTPEDRARCLALIHDSAAYNHTGAGMPITMMGQSNTVSLTCLSHVLDNTGDQLNAQNLKLFVSDWVGMFAHSDNVQHAWWLFAGSRMVSLSRSRRASLFNRERLFH